MNRDLVEYRLERSGEAMADAELLVEQRRNRSAVNRMYYALFYAANSLLATKGLASSKHSGVRALLNREFVKPGTISRETGATYSEMFGHRQRGDYVDYAEFSDDETRSLLRETRECLDELRRVTHEALAAQAD